MGLYYVWVVFGNEPNYWTNLNFDLIIVIDEKLEYHQSCYNSS